MPRQEANSRRVLGALKGDMSLETLSSEDFTPKRLAATSAGKRTICDPIGTAPRLIRQADDARQQFADLHGFRQVRLEAGQQRARAVFGLGEFG